jgi:hypothetical protein
MRIANSQRQCEMSLGEHEPDDHCDDPGHAKALLVRRQAKAASWSPIVLGQDRGGWRDFLDEQPIHCGSGLELQALEYRSDDYGEYTVALDRGALVRYEVEWYQAPPGARPHRVVLYSSVAGHSFTARHEAWMRFRWPAAEKR